MCAQKISSIVWGWTLSTDFVYGTDCFCEVVCSGESLSSSGLLAVERVRFTGSPEYGQERLQRNRSLGDFRSLSGASSKGKIAALFYFILKIGCATVCDVFLALGSWSCCFHVTVYIPRQLTSVYFCMCCRDFEGFFSPSSFCQRHHVPNITSSLVPICSKLVSRWCLESTWFTPLTQRPLGISPRVV